MLLKDGKRYSNVKKIICLMLVLFNMLVYLPVSTFGAPTASPTITVGSAEGKVGDTVNIPISFSNLTQTNKIIQYVQFELTYDKAYLEYTGMEKHFDESNDKELNDFLLEDFKNGKINVYYNLVGELPDVKDGKLITMHFNIKQDSPNNQKIDTSIIVKNGQKLNNENGRVTIYPDASPTSINTPTATDRPTPTKTTMPEPSLVNGLRGEYYNNSNFNGTPVKTSIKEIIDFPTNEPPVESSDYSIRWTGYFIPIIDGKYIFYIESARDQVKLYLDKDLDGEPEKINESTNVKWNSEIDLKANKRYKIIFEFVKLNTNGSLKVYYNGNNFNFNFKDLMYCEPDTLPSTPTPTQTPTPTKTSTTPTKTTSTPTKATSTPTKGTPTTTGSPTKGTPTPTAISVPYVPYVPVQSQPTAVQPLPTAIPQVIPSDLSLALSSDKTAYDAGQNIVFAIHYRNRLSTEVGNVKLSADIPPNTTFVDSSGGVVAGNKITWDLGTLQGNKEDAVKYTVKAEAFDGADKEATVTANISSTNSTDNTVDDNKSLLKIMLYAKKAVLGSHKKYINGYKDGTFKPDKPITRAEISALIVRVSGLTLSSDKQLFKDVSKDHWAFKEVNAAVSNGFFKGVTATLFKPDSNITKGELAAVICRCLGMEESSIDEADFFFSDTKNYWAGKYIEELYRCKIVVGSAGMFFPKNQVTRAEAVTMINRWLYRGPLNGKTLPFKDVTTSHWGYGHIAEAVFDHKYSRDPKGGEKYED